MKCQLYICFFYYPGGYGEGLSGGQYSQSTLEGETLLFFLKKENILIYL